MIVAKKQFIGQLYSRILLVLICIILLAGCSTGNNIHNLTEEYLDIDFLDNQHFTYYYYKHDLDDLVFKYCEGIYYHLDNNQIVLTPRFLSNENYDISVLEVRDPKIQGGIRLKLDLGLDFEEGDYDIRLFLNDKVFCFSGTSIDTIVSEEEIDRFRIEIQLSETIRDGKPIPTYDLFRTKEYSIDDHASNLFYVKIPIDREDFYYLNDDKIKLQDIGDRYVFLRNRREVLKGEHVLN